MPVYLDYNASTPVAPEVADAMQPFLRQGFGNPSSRHWASAGLQESRTEARRQVADLLGCKPAEIVFTSGGSEATNHALKGAYFTSGKRDAHIVTTQIEHPATIETCRFLERLGAQVTYLPVDGNGQVDLDWLAGALKRPGRAMVAIHHANNESGVIQPIVEAKALVAAAGGWLHVDAIQSAGKIPVSMMDLGADSLTLSGHKLGGLQGVGALVLGEGRSAVRILHGAGQERGYRAGTENVPGIAAFGVAAECAVRGLAHDQTDWRDAAAARLKAEGAVVVGEGAPRLPNTLFVATDGWDSPQQLISLDLKGVMVSAGSACSSGKTKPSRTMVAMGLEPLATFAIRVSGGWGTTESDWQAFADAWCEARARVRARQPVEEIA